MVRGKHELKAALEDNRRARELVSGEADRRQLAALEDWQRNRLETTYQDFGAQQRFAPATRFFTNELYAPRDFAERDHEIERIYPLLAASLPEATIDTVAAAVRLEALTQRLDLALERVLVAEGVEIVSMSTAQYAHAYRDADHQAERQHQIDLIIQVGEDLEELVRKRFIFTALKVARTPAHLAGMGQLQQFLESGFSAFRQMDNALPFLQQVRQREERILRRIYAGDADPIRDMHEELYPSRASS